MDLLRNQLAIIRQQLGGLSPSQKMLAGSLVAIMVMTLFLWTRYAARAEMEPVLDLPISAENISSISARLAGSGIPYQVIGDRIHVPADRKFQVIADLAYAQLLPSNTTTAFEQIISKTSFFTSGREREALRHDLLQATLSQVAKRLKNVRDAVVVIDRTRERGPNRIDPTAMIHMGMEPGQKPDDMLVQAAADIVCGAVAGLRRSNVRIIIDKQSYTVPDGDEAFPFGGGADKWLTLVQKGEKHWRGKVQEQLRWIDGVLIDVSVDPNLERVEKVSHTVDPRNSIAKPVSEQTSIEETASSQRGPVEPGIVPNSPLAVADAGAAADGATSTIETSKTEFLADYGRTDTKSWNAGGQCTVTGVSVLVPRSFLIRTYQTVTKSLDQEPEKTALETYMTAELRNLENQISAGLGISLDGVVRASAYTDLVPVFSAAPTAASTSISLMMTDHVKEIALGVLALASLFMVTTMVKRSAPAPVALSPAPMKPVQLPAEEAVGEAGVGSPFLDGMEVDEDSVKAQEMLNQVSTMVGENPEAAAALVKRWLNRP